MSLPTCHLEYGRHLARLHRRRAYAPTRNTASQKAMRKSTHGFPFASYMGMGLRLAALGAAGAPLLFLPMFLMTRLLALMAMDYFALIYLLL